MIRPIIFSAPQVRAILDGRKTQDRRVIKPTPWNRNGDCVDISIAKSASYVCGADGRMYYQFDHPAGGPLTAYPASYAPGDLLWARETWAHEPDEYELTLSTLVPARQGGLWYRADGEVAGGQWHSPVAMPRWASRLTLEVTGVKVERLQDITEADAVEEGIQQWPIGYLVEVCGAPSHISRCFDTPQDAMRFLWNKANGLAEKEWAANPWVAAIAFTAYRRNVDDLVRKRSGDPTPRPGSR